MAVSQNDANRIHQAVVSKGATQPCPRCGRAGPFSIGGYSYLPIRDTPTDVQIAGNVAVYALTACDGCGFTALHALHALGIR